MAQTAAPDPPPPPDRPLASLTRRFAALAPNTRGALWMLLAAVGFSAMAALVKLAAARLDAGQILFFRCFFGFLLLFPMIWRAGLPATFGSGRLPLHLGRALVGVCAMGCFFYAIPRAPLADVTAISFAKPLFLIVLAIVFLGERVRWRRWSATAIGFLGVVVMLRPGGAGFEPVLLLALAGAFFVACAVILVKKMSSSENDLTMLAWFGLVSSLVFVLPAAAVWKHPTGPEWLMLIGIGAFGVTAQSFIIRAYRAGEATVVAPFDYSRIVFATLFGFVLFGHLPDLYTFVGMAMIVASTAYIARREARLGRAGADPREGAVRKI